MEGEAASQGHHDVHGVPPIGATERRTLDREAKIADPENRLLWRMNLRRLDAETLRDSLIAVAGKLDATMGGPPIKLAMEPDGLQVVSGKEAPASRWRRSIYLTARRNYPLSFLNVFDYPPSTRIARAVCSRRHRCSL